MKTILLSIIATSINLYSQNYEFKHFREYAENLKEAQKPSNFQIDYSYQKLPPGYSSIEKAVNAEARIRLVPISIDLKKNKNKNKTSQQFSRAFDRKKSFLYQTKEGKEKVLFSYFHYSEEDFKAFDFYQVLGMNKYKDIKNFSNLGIEEIVGGFPIGIKTTEKLITKKNVSEKNSLYRCEGYFKADHNKDDAQTMTYFSCYSGVNDSDACFFLSVNYCKSKTTNPLELEDIKNLVNSVAHLNFNSPIITEGDFINPRISKKELQICRNLIARTKKSDDHFPIDKYIHEGKVLVTEENMKGHGEHLARLCNDIYASYSEGNQASDILAITD